MPSGYDLGTHGRSPMLRRGDLIGVVSPSWFGGAAFVSRAEYGIHTLERLGFQVRVGEHAFRSHGHVSDTAANRAADLNDMFANPEIRAILCTIGGTHAVDVLRHLDWAVIEQNPKPFIGYSDSSTLNLALHARTGLHTINGPYLLSDWAEFPAMPQISLDWIMKLLTSPEPPGELPCPDEWTSEFLDWTTGADRTRRRQHQPNHGWRVVRHGHAEGPLVGGCLECLNLLMGSRYQPDFAGAVLFLETAGDINSPYATDELLAGLELAGVFDEIAALLFAKPTSFSPADRDIFECLLTERVSRHAFPVIADMDFGHHSPMIAMPLGPQTAVETAPVRIQILKSPVI